MTRPGLRAAHEHARHLLSFSDLRDAEKKLFARRDHDLAALLSLVNLAAAFHPDFSPDSLKALEAWYLTNPTAARPAPDDQEQLERFIGAYFGEVLVRNNSFEWFVTEYAFAPGKFDIGVRRGGVAVMLTATMGLAARPNNARKQSLWRDYRKYAA